MKLRWKRMLSGMLAAVMLLTMLPATALAAVSETANMEQAQREAILAELQSITGSEQEAESLYHRMQALGLFDADGNWTTEKLQINGEEYTLAEARSFVDTLTDDTFVTVGETTITAADLRTMIEIEEEIARIRDTYFNGEEWTDEEKENLSSLEQALNNGDVIVRSEPLPELIGPSGVNHNARVSVTVDNDTFQNSEPGTATVTLTLTGAADGQAVTFDYTTLDGSAYAGENYTAVTGMSVTLTNGTPVTITVETKKSDERWNGNRLFFLQISNLKNALFENGTDCFLQTFQVSNTGYDTTTMDTISGDRKVNILPQNVSLDGTYLNADVSDGTIRFTSKVAEGEAAPFEGFTLEAYPFGLWDYRYLFQDGIAQIAGSLEGNYANCFESFGVSFSAPVDDGSSVIQDRVVSSLILKATQTEDGNSVDIPLDDQHAWENIKPNMLTLSGGTNLPVAGTEIAAVSIAVEDYNKPQIAGNVKAGSQGTFLPGMKVPVVITFSEPVWGAVCSK